MPDGSDDPSGRPGGGAGDLGRRLRERRLDLGLTVQEVARRAGMDPVYLEHAEGTVASVSAGALLRLAAALETTTDALAGGGIERPQGGGPAAAPQLEELSEAESVRLLGEGGVGRVLFVADSAPVALPVNFRLLGGDVLFRTEVDGPIDRAVGPEGAELGFEVDHVDDALAEGWSVLIRGRARRVAAEAELVQAREAGLEPWAGGERDRYVRLEPDAVTGRRIRVR